jgi:hypothetical protein
MKFQNQTVSEVKNSSSTNTLAHETRKKTAKTLSILSALAVIIIIAGVMVGCQKEDVYNTDLPFLSFNNNILKTGELHEEDLNVLALAFQRINLIQEDGLYYMVETSAKQINVSKEVFTYLKDMEKRSNKRVLEYVNKFSSIPRLKNGNESGGGTSNDCVAQTVVNIAQSMGTSLSLSTVKSWIEQKYGTNGVPSSKISEVVSHYFTNSSVTISNGYTPPSGKQVFVVFNFGGGKGHASKYLSCSDGYVLCSDGFYSLSQVAYSYLISKVN